MHWRFFVKTRLFEVLREPVVSGRAAVAEAFESVRRRYLGIPA